jgi:hypothetical protein
VSEEGVVPAFGETSIYAAQTTTYDCGVDQTLHKRMIKLFRVHSRDRYNEARRGKISLSISKYEILDQEDEVRINFG